MTLLKNYNIKQIVKENFLLKYSSTYSSAQIEIFRITIALFAIFSILGTLLDYNYLLSPNGLINWEVNNANLFWFELSPYKIAHLLNIHNNYACIFIIAIYLFSLLCLLLGFYTRLSALISLFSFVCILNMQTVYGYGVDVYQSVNFFILCVFPSGYTYAIKKRNSTINSKEIQQICIRVLQVYLCITYANAGLEKSVMPSWWNGKFIYLVLNDPTYASFDFISNLKPGFYKFFGAITILAESFYMFFVWIPIIRTIGIFVIIIMHLFIAFGMGLFSFGMLLILLNLCIWYPAIINDFKKIKLYVKSV